jgi:tetratricopeptide (TPR) repeat protein
MSDPRAAIPVAVSAAILAWVAATGCGESRRELPAGASAPLFSDLGDHHLPITTAAPLAQRYFDQGLVLSYGFNHAEAVRSYREAQRLDPACAICLWGEAYALGPNINKAMDPTDAPRAWEALQRALRLAPSASELERALIGALAKRYAPEPPEDRAPLDRAYADAMRAVAAAYPEHPDVLALYAESLLDTAPWDYYAGGAPKPDTALAVAALEHALAIAPRHPGALHFYIHAVEPEKPERGESAADRLRDLVPGAGHLVHMPSHIYLRVGRYHDASVVNEKAAAADESYITQCRAQGFYPSNYYPHNIDFLQASASFEGRSRLAIDSARRLRNAIPDATVSEHPNVEEFMPRHLFALVRFGRWREVLAQDEPVAQLRYLRGTWHYARGIALAATGEGRAAEAQLASLSELRGAWETDPQGRVFLSGATPAQLLAIAERVLEARIAGERGAWEHAIPALRNAVSLQDALPYAEPPPWYFPVREALGYALLEAGRPAEAERVYREQLAQTPETGWSLYGLGASLRAQANPDEAAEVARRFAAAWKRADVTLERPIF